MTIRCPKCGSTKIKDYMQTVLKHYASDGKYFCESCGYIGSLIWEGEDFKKAGEPQQDDQAGG